MSACGKQGYRIGLGLERGSEKTAKRILELLADGPMRPSGLREAVGIKSRILFSRYYMTPLLTLLSLVSTFASLKCHA